MRHRYTLFVLILVALFIGNSDGQKKQLNVFTWAGYVSDDIREGFEKEYGVNVLIDTYASNEDLLAKLLAGATGYDIIMPSDYMVSILIKQNLLAELNRDNIPKLPKYQSSVSREILRCRKPIFYSLHIRHCGDRLRFVRRHTGTRQLDSALGHAIQEPIQHVRRPARDHRCCTKNARIQPQHHRSK